MAQIRLRDISDSELIFNIKKIVPDISSSYNRKILEKFYMACYGDYEKDFSVKIEKEVECKKSIDVNSINRRKIRINLDDDSSYAKSLIDTLSSQDVVLRVCKTGLIVKAKYKGYETNIINFQELRLIDGILVGNLVVHVLKNEEMVENINTSLEGIIRNNKIVFMRVNVNEVENFVCKSNIDKLIDLAINSSKRKKKNSARLINKIS